jgi:selenocysteine lyase/cysteine desulfurase
MEELTCRRGEFSIPAGVHYLNCAYLGPLPRVVQDAGVAGVLRKGNPSTITTRDFFADSEEVRRLFAELIHARAASRIAILPAVSYGVATVAKNIGIEPHQSIVIVGEDFPSDAYAWRKLARTSGARLKVVAPPASAGSRGAAWNEAVVDAIGPETGVVAVPHVHWADGTRFDLGAIGSAARRVGAALIVDGTQSVGAMPIDIEDVRPDALICAGYKWLLGPYSSALAYFGERFDNGEPLEENWISRKGSDDFQRLVDYRDEYEAGAVRFDVGERSNFILLPMMIAALKLLLELTPERIQRYCDRLTREAFEQIRENGFELEDARWRGAHLFGLRAPANIDLAQLNRTLRERNVYVSLRGSAIRVSPHVYNDEADLRALVEALETAVATSAVKL